MMREELADGEYVATCRERNSIAAAMNGHGQVFPQARMKVTGQRATFYRDGAKVWACNTAYAALHFTVKRV